MLPMRGKAWIVKDRYGHEIYLTWERWSHIVEFHPEMEPFFEAMRRIVRTARRRQDPLNPHKWFYVGWEVEGLQEWNNCIVVVVVLRPPKDRFVVTAYQDYIPRK
ncbi:MAG TPA: hypothetical protein ENK56_08505 [Chloroflexi bacterium]|nr:hypothetical protein [Chloroflexota bacterium]